jgi:hypothetical protein
MEEDLREEGIAASEDLRGGTSTQRSAPKGASCPLIAMEALLIASLGATSATHQTSEQRWDEKSGQVVSFTTAVAPLLDAHLMRG